MGDAGMVGERQDSIKLSKLSKGYNWEIKRYYDFEKTKPEAVIEQLEGIDRALHERFGSGDGR